MAQSAVLSPLDQLMPRSYILIGLLFQTEDHAKAIEQLTAGLQRLFEDLPYLGGQVYQETRNRKQLAIRWKNAITQGPSIEIKPTPENYKSYGEIFDRGESFPFTFFSQHSADLLTTDEGTAVFAASAVKIEGGLILCVAIHHNVMDGTGAGLVIKRWAELTNAKTSVSDATTWHPQFSEPLERVDTIYRAISSLEEDGAGIDLSILLRNHPEFKLGSRSAPTTPGLTKPTAAGCSHIFRFSHSKLAATRESLLGFVDPKALSINNILSAILWSHISHIRSRRADHTGTLDNSKLVFATNGRSRLGLTDTNYAGNVNIYALAELPFYALVNMPSSKSEILAPIASEIARAIAQIDTQHVAELVHMVDGLPHVTDLKPGWDFFNGPDLSITSWANLGFYDADFGEGIGTPELVRIPYVPIDGLAVILPRKRRSNQAQGEEVLEVTVMLREDDMKTLSDSPEWKSWLI